MKQKQHLVISFYFNFNLFILFIDLVSLDQLLENESLIKSDTPIITFANKQDLPVSSI